MTFFKKQEPVVHELPALYEELLPSERREVREQYVEQQGGFCMHCFGCLKQVPPSDITDKPVRPELYPSNFFDHPVHLHHSHDTGLTLGAVHAYCNAVLWEYHNE